MRDMLQRGVSWLVLVGFVASQLAAVGHAYAWTSLREQQQHDATPHVHWFGSSSHRHDHAHGGHAHSHPHQRGDNRGQANSSQDRDTSVPASEHNDSDHDASAIFISVCLGLPVTGTSPVLPTVASELTAVPGSPVREVEAKIWLPMCWHPPDADWPGSHLYLSLRNLRL